MVKNRGLVLPGGDPSLLREREVSCYEQDGEESHGSFRRFFLHVIFF